MKTLESRFVRGFAGMSLCLLAVSSFQFAEARMPELPARATLPVARTPRPLSPWASLVDFAAARAAGVSLEVLNLALGAVSCAAASGDIAAPPTLTLIDYSRPSVEPRLWVFDLGTGGLLYKELVAHGRNTGDNLSRYFSDRMNSLQSSIGLFVTRDTYVGANGYSLRMDGLEPGFNGRARDRAIVMHGAPYVSADIAARQGRLGRSWGCPALRETVAREIIDTVRGGGVVFSYYPDRAWLNSSRFLNGCWRRATAERSPGLGDRRARIDQRGVHEVRKLLAQVRGVRQHLDHQHHRQPRLGIDVIPRAVRAAPAERADRAHAVGAVPVDGFEREPEAKP